MEESRRSSIWQGLRRLRGKFVMVSPVDVVAVTGIRSGILKLEPVIRELDKRKVRVSIVDINEHKGWFDKGVFYMSSDIPEPFFDIKVSDGDGWVLECEEKIRMVLEEEGPDLTLVCGSSKTAFASGLACAKLGIPMGHIESGYRTYDIRTEAEFRRQSVDRLSTLLFAPTRTAYQNLLLERTTTQRPFLTGSTLLDSFNTHARDQRRHSEILRELDLRPDSYILFAVSSGQHMTPDALQMILQIVRALGRLVVLPTDEEMKRCIRSYGVYPAYISEENLVTTETMVHSDFLSILSSAACVLTDSLSVAEEAVYAGCPTILIGERPGSAELSEASRFTVCRLHADPICETVDELLRTPRPPERGDVLEAFGSGRAGERIAKHLVSFGTKLRHEPPGPFEDLEFYTLLQNFEGLGPVEIQSMIDELDCRLVRCYDSGGGETTIKDHNLSSILAKGTRREISMLADRLA